MLILLIVTAYAVALVSCYRRWREPGVVALALLVMGAYALRGTWEWSQPHLDSRSHDWQCHSLQLVAPIAVFTVSGLIALTVVKHKDLAAGWWDDFLTVLGAFGLAMVPAFVSLLMWTIEFWACDTL